MRVRVINTLDDLASDTRKVATGARTDMRRVVRNGIRVGNDVAKGYAKRSAGAHGKHYHRAFSAEMHESLFGSGAATISGEYGPERGKRQGDMSFEGGSRNQPGHRDLARSADLIGGSFGQEVAGLPAEWFWPAS